MFPVFSNVWGFYALLGIPAVLAIHFLQHKSKKVTTSTLFLIDTLTPESRTGRVWERIRNSLPLWMQILCILLLTWVIVKPRWIQENAWQTVAFVLDDGIRMQAFKQEAVQALKDDMQKITAKGIPTHWVVMTDSPRTPPLYRGDDPARAVASLESWNPKAGDHDPTPALRTAQAITAGNGASRFITCSASNLPDWQSAIGVGSPIDNVGFVGLIPEESAKGSQWRVAVKNNSRNAQTREIEIVTGNANHAPIKQTISLNPLSVTELKVALPPQADSMLVKLSPDQFPADDVLPVMREVPKKIEISVETNDKSSDFFKKLVSSIPGAALSPGSSSQIRILSTNILPDNAEQFFIVLPSKTSDDKLKSPVIAEDHPLTRDLSWGGLLFAKTGHFPTDMAFQTLLWSGDTPLAWLQQKALVLNWDWETSNADRIPATVLMLRRFLLSAGDRISSFSSTNTFTGAKVAVQGAKTLRFTSIDGKVAETPYWGVMPRDPGFVGVFGADDLQNPLFSAGIYPADARQGDFSQCSSFVKGSLQQERILERISSPDPFVPLWLALAALAAIVGWIPNKKERSDQAS